MRNKINFGIVVAAALFSSVASASSFYLDATNPFNGATLNLAAGDYQITYVSGAWNPWGTNPSGCDNAGQCSGVGWYNAFTWTTTSGSTTFWDGIRWQNSTLAEVSGQNHSPINFTLSQTQAVNFYIGDNPYYDNSGGISLSVTPAPVPLPAAAWLLGSGLLGLFGMARRKAAY